MSYRPGSSEKWRRCLLSDGFAAGLLSLVPLSAVCSILIGLSLFFHFSGVSFDRWYLGTESSVFSRPVYCHNALSRFVVISPCLGNCLFSFLDVLYLCFCGDPNPPWLYWQTEPQLFWDGMQGQCICSLPCRHMRPCDKVLGELGGCLVFLLMLLPSWKPEISPEEVTSPPLWGSLSVVDTPADAPAATTHLWVVTWGKIINISLPRAKQCTQSYAIRGGVQRIKSFFPPWLGLLGINQFFPSNPQFLCYVTDVSFKCFVISSSFFFNLVNLLHIYMIST